jgi:hypothetical protein
MARHGRWIVCLVTGFLAAFARIILTGGLLAGMVIAAFGQSRLPRTLDGLALGGLFPTGAFNQHVSQEGLGAAAYYARRLGRSPLMLGLEVSYAEYGHVYREEFAADSPDGVVDVNTSNNLSQAVVLLRLQPRRGRIMTFLEALAGASYFWTRTTVGESEPEEDLSPLAADNDFEDIAWSAGVGAGLSVQLMKSEKADPTFPRSGLFLELKVRYMAGGQAEYLKKGSIVVVGGEYTFTPERSATSHVTVQLGLSFLY